MGRHSGDCCFEIAACKSSQASVVCCVCGGIIINTVVSQRGSIFWGVGHRSVADWAWFTASDAMLVLAASGRELPVSERFISGLRARCNTLKYSGLDHSEMHSLGTETQYTDLRIRRYKLSRRYCRMMRSVAGIECPRSKFVQERVGSWNYSNYRGENRLGNEKFQLWASRKTIVRQFPKKGVRQNWGSDSRYFF